MPEETVLLVVLLPIKQRTAPRRRQLHTKEDVQVGADLLESSPDD
ncbi:hypothetical protein SAMN06296273_2394 [Nitrosomonas ureae]|uniref:Uncharacterized protein n=1 Tax=Nitrosomonas ureae TaxID=44577 RepID=A0A285C1L7_9PROT|nr:hypothetical protein SAMN06296273_2394 [Nitrosomonas ureae]